MRGNPGGVTAITQESNSWEMPKVIPGGIMGQLFREVFLEKSSEKSRGKFSEVPYGKSQEKCFEES